MNTANHWTQDALIHAEQLVGEAALSDSLDGEPLGIAANYLQAAAEWLMADNSIIHQREARRQYLFAQEQERRYRHQEFPRQTFITQEMADDVVIRRDVLGRGEL